MTAAEEARAELLEHAARMADMRTWVGDALCVEVGPEAFFPEKGEQADTAERVCARCPVMRQCLDYAVRRNERYGVWGLSERKRRILRQQRETGAA